MTARRPINVRAETVATSAMFKSAFAARRCIVPATAFYEWRKTVPKQPFAIARQDGQPMALEAQDWPVWLGEQDGDAAALPHPAAEDVLRLWPVSTRVNEPKNDGADLLEPSPPSL